MKPNFNLSEMIFIDRLRVRVVNVSNIKEAVRLLKEELFKESFERGLPLDDGTLDRLPLKFVDETINNIFGKGLSNG